MWGDLPGQPPLEGSREFPIGSARKESQAVSGGPCKEVEFKVRGGRGREEVVAWRRALETCRGCPSAGTRGSYQGQERTTRKEQAAQSPELAQGRMTSAFTAATRETSSHTRC